MAVDAQYMTLDPDQPSIGLFCTTVGSADTPPGSDYPPSRTRHPTAYRDVNGQGRVLDEHQLVHIRRGSGVYQDAEGEHSISAGTVLILRPGLWHRYHPDPSTGWTEYWVGFGGEMAEPALRLAGLGDSGPIHRTGANSQVASLYERLIGLSHHHDQRSVLKQTSVLLGLIAEIAEIAQAEDQDGPSPGDIVAVAKMVMQEHMENPVGITEIAHRAGVSESTIRRGFHVATGMSPYRYYLIMRINRSKQLLAHTRETLLSIAGKYGFTDQYHYSRVFRQLTGMAPGQWRRSRRQSR